MPTRRKRRRCSSCRPHTYGRSSGRLNLNEFMACRLSARQSREGRGKGMGSGRKAVTTKAAHQRRLSWKGMPKCNTVSHRSGLAKARHRAGHTTPPPPTSA